MDDILAYLSDLRTELDREVTIQLPEEDLTYRKARYCIGIAWQSLISDPLATCKRLYQGTEPVPRVGSQCNDADFMVDAAYYIQYASIAYGAKNIGGFLVNLAAFFQILPEYALKDRHVRVLKDRCKFKEEDIVHYRWEADHYAPSWYCVKNRSSGTLVVAVRGTASISDMLVDLVATPLPYSHDGVDGFVHEGMHKSAERIFPEMLEHIKEVYKENPNFDLVITGHSLGAGVAVLLTLKVLREFPQVVVRCFAYAVPAVLSKNLALKAQDYDIFSFALNADIVPRLSLNSLHEYFRNSTHGRKPPKDSHHIVMLPPGHVYSLWSPTHGVEDCQMLKAHPIDFSSILFAKSRVEHHSSCNYEIALKAIVENLTSNNHM